MRYGALSPETMLKVLAYVRDARTIIPFFQKDIANVDRSPSRTLNRMRLDNHSRRVLRNRPLSDEG
jgi:hypothetical protein